MRREIILAVRMVGNSLDMKVRDVVESYFIPSQNMQIKAIEYNFQRNCILLYLVHGEFPPVEDYCHAETYTVEEAQNRFPWLFLSVNPLYWRRF